MVRVAIVTNMLPPYRVPLFNYLAAQPGIVFRAFLCTRSEPNRHWDWPQDIRFDYEIGSTLTVSPVRSKTVYLNFGLVRRLREFKPDVVVVGGMGSLGLAAWLGAKLAGASLVLWSEGTSNTAGRLGAMLLPLRKFLVRRSSSFVGVSTAAAEYFHRLGAESSRVFVSLQTLDVRSFWQSVQRHAGERQSLKRAFGLEGPVFAYFGNLEPYKGPDLLLEAYLRVVQSCPAAELLLVGTGSMHAQLDQRAAAAGVGRVHFVGFKQHNELPAYYAVSDVACLFSRREPFGVVATEAVAAGLPLLCSRFAGAAKDLVEHGQNGYVVDPADIMTNAGLMARLLSDDELRARMGERSSVIAQKCAIETAGDAMLDAVERALPRG